MSTYRRLNWWNICTNYLCWWELIREVSKFISISAQRWSGTVCSYIAQMPVPVPISSTFLGPFPIGARKSLFSRMRVFMWCLRSMSQGSPLWVSHVYYPISHCSFAAASFGPLYYMRKNSFYLEETCIPILSIPKVVVRTTLNFTIIANTIRYGCLCWTRPMYTSSLTWHGTLNLERMYQSPKVESESSASRGFSAETIAGVVAAFSSSVFYKK
jgi:hypothetical protein